MEHANRPADPSDSADTSTAQQQLFMATLLSLSWQLLIVVVVPFWGGYWLDDHFNSKPLWTLVGMGLALVLAIITIYQAYKTLVHKQSAISGKGGKS